WNSGVWLGEKDDRVVVTYVSLGGSASNAGLKVGDVVEGVNGAQVLSLADARQKLAAGSTAFVIDTADGRTVQWLSGNGPPRSVPIHAAQLYAAIDAALLALVLWLCFPYRRHDGEVFALLITLHPLSRILLEMIRSDEPGQFGTSFTISQWISL